MEPFRLVAGVLALLCLQGCASLCGNNSTREGVWGITLRCQTAQWDTNAPEQRISWQAQAARQSNFK